MGGFGVNSRKENNSSDIKFKKFIKEAFKYQSKGQLLKAKSIYISIVKKGCTNLLVLNNLASILRREANYDEALELLNKAIELYPNNSDSYSIRALIYMSLNRLDSASSSIDKALEIKPDDFTYSYNKAIIIQRKGDFDQAEKLFNFVLKRSPNYTPAISDLALLHVETGDLDKAEIGMRKAIELSPMTPKYHSNLASILNHKGELELAGEKALETIKINPFSFKAYFILSNSKQHQNNEYFLHHLFSKELANRAVGRQKIDLAFARSNVLHRNSKYSDSAFYLKSANDQKLVYFPTDVNQYIRVGNKIFNITSNLVPTKENLNTEYIFIVGMPRSGSTLTESIISMKSNIFDLGETQILEEALHSLNLNNNLDQIHELSSLYDQKRREVVNCSHSNSIVTTDKQLYNYSYVPFIASQFPTAKIIHCYRNPLDNILSIYRAHFAKGSQYASCLKSSANLYIYQDQLMEKYKNVFPKNIFSLDYDQLVSNPEDVITKLVEWLNWDWDDIYLSPHLNNRSVATASNVQVRSPINNKSVGGWLKYKDLLTPALNEISKTKKFSYLKDI